MLQSSGGLMAKLFRGGDTSRGDDLQMISVDKLV